MSLEVVSMTTNQVSASQQLEESASKAARTVIQEETYTNYWNQATVLLLATQPLDPRFMTTFWSIGCRHWRAVLASGQHSHQDLQTASQSLNGPSRRL